MDFDTELHELQDLEVIRVTLERVLVSDGVRQAWLDKEFCTINAGEPYKVGDLVTVRAPALIFVQVGLV